MRLGGCLGSILGGVTGNLGSHQLMLATGRQGHGCMSAFDALGNWHWYLLGTMAGMIGGGVAANSLVEFLWKLSADRKKQQSIDDKAVRGPRRPRPDD